MRHVVAIVSALSLSACAADTTSLPDDEESPMFADGKLDSFFEPTLHGTIPFGERQTATFGDEMFHAWDFTLSGNATITAETAPYRRGGRAIDTVLYVYRLEGGRMVRPYVAKFDDISRTNKWSKLERRLSRGTYRLLAVTNEGSPLGAFALTVGCAGSACTPGAAASTLHVPLLDENADELLTSLNPKLQMAGLRTLPEVVVLDASNSGSEYQEIHDFLASDPVTALFPEGEPSTRAYGTPDDYSATLPDGRKVEMCYTGDAGDVANLLFSITDNVLSDQFVLYAYRYGTEKWLDENVEDEGSLLDAWGEYDTHSTDLLVLYTTSDSGDEEAWSHIPRCRD